MLVCAGISFSASGFLIPQLEDPAVGFGITSDDGSWICQESPTWFISKGKEAEAENELVKLRGENNMDVINKEFGRIAKSEVDKDEPRTR